MSARFPYADVSPLLRAELARHGAAVADLPLAGIAGSRRAYYRAALERVAGSDGDAAGGLILLVSPPDDADFGRFLRITQFYRLLGVPVPKVHGVDDDARQVLLEDLGTCRLQDLLHRDRPAGLEAYRRALEMLADLQTRCDAWRHECPDIATRTFDRTQLLWETSYYRTHYLEGHRGLKTDPALQTVFEALAARVDAQPKAIMHRDYQSQNLMVQGANVRLIDYQGSRYGSVFYDAASLLLDPYVMLADDEIETLLTHFQKVSGVGSFAEDAAAAGGGDVAQRVVPEGADGYAAFRTAFLEAGLQRVMQALGAYCFLSRTKGIAEFAAHIPAGESRLRWLIRRTGDAWARILPE